MSFNDSEFRKRQRAANTAHYKAGTRIAVKYKAGKPEQTKEQEQRMFLEFGTLKRPPYHHLFEFEFADTLGVHKYSEVIPLLDAWFPSPDAVDLQYVEDIVFTVLSPSQRDGRLGRTSIDDDFKEKALKAREWVTQKRQPNNTVSVDAGSIEKIVPAEVTQSSIADLCIAPMTSDLLASLLKHLGVLEQTGPPYKLYKGVDGLKGKGKNRISKSVAAFQVLSEDGFFNPDRSLWPSAALRDYGLPIGEKALGYHYHGTGERGSPSYDRAADNTIEWLNRQKQLDTDS
ncbi:DUF5343 domain-containing protein [Hymenobacter sp. NST-14]|uniref:DUF5343 domain-containing protein n=1 Tax=Hymenobacter piscis TaxID=2839984 RepID=UPI001C01C52C|nr:DUF5343 domain-containing protein [Hymenobacter piscis]MBT9392086.1 DUF5343 domain-containing protein [Hymenobacter piscis]